MSHKPESTAVLRHATVEDLTLVTSWVTSQEETDVWSGGPVSYPIDIEECRLAIGWEHAANRTLMDLGQVAGFGQIIDKPGARKHLARIVVDPGMRGRGLGRQLVEGLLGQARDSGARCMSLNVHPGNETAIRLYASFGFVPAENPEPGRTGRFIHMQCPA